jgi:hypothetical protein
MKLNLKAAAALVVLAAAGTAQATPIAPEGLFLSLRDSTNLTSLVVNLNLTTTTFRGAPTATYTLSGDGLADLTAYLTGANLGSVRWNVAGASNGAFGSSLYGGLSTSSTNPAATFQDWGIDVVQNTNNQFGLFRGVTNAGLTSSEGWTTTGNGAYFTVSQGGTSFVNALGTIGQSLGFYSFFANPDDEFSGLSTAFAGNWTLSFLNGVAGLTYVSAVTPPVPVPAAVWLLASGVAGLFGVSRRRKQAAV